MLAGFAAGKSERDSKKLLSRFLASPRSKTVDFFEVS